MYPKFPECDTGQHSRFLGSCVLSVPPANGILQNSVGYHIIAAGEWHSSGRFPVLSLTIAGYDRP